MPTNKLLESLSPASRQRILRSCKHMALHVRTTLVEVEEPIQYAYFLTSGFASVVVELAEGGVAEVALIGHEGVTGGMQLLGPALSPTRCFVQMEASGYRMPFAELRKLFMESEEIRDRFLELAQQQSFTTSQIAACNKLHDTDARLARWLLMVRDRVESNTLNLTQEFLGQMLGTQRTTVVLTAGAFQRGGIITYTRGRVTILKPEELEDAACECYQIVRQLYLNVFQTHAFKLSRPPL